MRLIGRVDDLAAIEQTLADGSEGVTALSVIAAAGMGKTALLDAAADRARGSGRLVLRCCGAEAEAALAYSAVTDLLAPVMDAIRGWLPEPQRRALQVATLEIDPGEAVVEPHAVARALTEALRVLADRTPLLVVIDDAHWLDAESARVLSFAIRRLDDQWIALIAGYREDPGSGNELQSALRSLGARHALHRLRPLTVNQIEQLLHGHRLSLPRAALRHVQATAGGHPLYALELARHAASEGTAGMPASLAALLDRRLRRLPGEALPVIAAAAEMAVATRASIRSAVDAKPRIVDAAVDAAVDAGIVEEVGGVVRFTHPLLAEAAVGTSTSTARREVHRRLAAAVTDVEQRAVHLGLAHTGPDEEIAATVEDGARRARARGAPEIAAELMSAALRLTPAEETASLRRRRIDAAYQNAAAGRPAAGVDLLNAALAAEPPGESRIDLQWRTAMMHFLVGDLAACIAQLEDAWQRTGDVAVRNHLSTRLANMCCWAGDFRRGAEVAGMIDLDQLDGSYRCNARGTVCMTNFGAGRPPGMDPWEVIAEFEQLQPQPPAHEHPINRLMHQLTMCGPAQDVALATIPVLARATDEADDLGVAWLAATLTHAELRTGRWHLASEAARTSLHAALRTGSAPALVFGLGAAATVAALLGEAEEAADLAAQLIRLNSPQPILSCVGTGHSVLGFLAMTGGDAAAARSEYMLAHDSLDREMPDQPAIPPLRWFLVDALIDAGELVEAEARIVWLEGLPDNSLAAAFAATGRGRLAALRGDREAADAAFDAALDAHDRLGWPFERAVALYRQGCALRDQRRRSRARSVLGEALEIFASLGAAPWAARARDALAGISGRAPSSPDALTRTEQDVAELAVAGLTNQQIAERLFVSPKTVATHLSHVYAKLHVRSRTELAARMSGDGATVSRISSTPSG
jgi:DNA-binding CsgD family transcriptional regulator